MAKQETHGEDERMVRILSKDIRGKTKIYSGLTKIKGISWAMSNAICKKMNIDKNKKIGSLNEKEIKEIEEFIKKADIPGFLKNRNFDFESGKGIHLTGSDLDLVKEFDIKRLKKIRTYRGLRHSVGLPSRGQRTRSHFRKNRKKAGGIKPSGAKKPKEKND